MKKIYLLAFAVCTSVVASAQFKQTPASTGKQPLRGMPTTTVAPLSADRDVIWSDDFSDCSNWVTGNANEDAGLTDYIAGINFECGTGLSPNGPAAIDPIASTTADNGFMMVDSDEFGGPTPGTWIENCWFQTANPITVTGETALSIRFETFYRMWDNGSSDGNEYCLVEISLDGTTWPDLTNEEVSANTTPNTWRYELWPNMETQDPVTNPTVRVFNITEALASNPDQIWVRFRWKGYYGYSWMVDDVQIFQTPDNDLTLGKVWVGDIVNDFEYRVVAASQAGEVSFGAEVANYGGVDQTATIDFDVDGTIYSVTETILAGTVDTVWTELFMMPSELGQHNLTVTLPEDEDLVGNVGTSYYTVTDFIYGQNYDEDLFQRTFNSDQDVAFGCLYGINADAQCGAVNIMFGDATDVGINAQVFVYQVLSNIQDLSQVGASTEFTINQGMVDAGANGEYTVIGLWESGAIDLLAGELYVVEIRKFESTDRMYVAANQYDDDFGTVCYGPFGTGSATNWFNGWNFTPAVRMNLDPTATVSENTVSDLNLTASIYPNPATDNTFINVDLMNSDRVSVVVRDITGRLIANENFGLLQAGQTRLTLNVSNYPAGIYSVSVQAGNSIVTEQIVVR